MRTLSDEVKGAAGDPTGTNKNGRLAAIISAAMPCFFGWLSKRPPDLADRQPLRHFLSMRTGRPPKRPGTIEPCIPTLVSKPPEGPQWIHEIKHDGYRLIGRKRDVRVSLFTRRGYEWTDRYPMIRDALATLEATSAVIDGEAVYCDDTGLAVFDKLHSRAHDRQVVLFDLLEFEGEDWTPRPLQERKAKLQTVLAKVSAGIQFNEHLEGDGAAIFAHACKLGCEGIVSKRRDHAYRSGISKAWLKIKNPKAPGVLRFKHDEP